MAVRRRLRRTDAAGTHTHAASQHSGLYDVDIAEEAQGAQPDRGEVAGTAREPLEGWQPEDGEKKKRSQIERLVGVASALHSKAEAAGVPVLRNRSGCCRSVMYSWSLALVFFGVVVLMFEPASALRVYKTESLTVVGDRNKFELLEREPVVVYGDIDPSKIWGVSYMRRALASWTLWCVSQELFPEHRLVAAATLAGCLLVGHGTTLTVILVLYFLEVQYASASVPTQVPSDPSASFATCGSGARIVAMSPGPAVVNNGTAVYAELRLRVMEPCVPRLLPGSRASLLPSAKVDTEYFLRAELEPLQRSVTLGCLGIPNSDTLVDLPPRPPEPVRVNDAALWAVVWQSKACESFVLSARLLNYTGLVGSRVSNCARALVLGTPLHNGTAQATSVLFNLTLCPWETRQFPAGASEYRYPLTVLLFWPHLPAAEPRQMLFHHAPLCVQHQLPVPTPDAGDDDGEWYSFRGPSAPPVAWTAVLWFVLYSAMLVVVSSQQWMISPNLSVFVIAAAHATLPPLIQDIGFKWYFIVSMLSFAVPLLWLGCKGCRSLCGNKNNFSLPSKRQTAGLGHLFIMSVLQLSGGVLAWTATK